MCETQHDLTHPLPVQIEQLYHNINTWRTSTTVMRERYGEECASLSMGETLAKIEHGCTELAEAAIALYNRVATDSCQVKNTLSGDISV